MYKNTQMKYIFDTISTTLTTLIIIDSQTHQYNLHSNQQTYYSQCINQCFDNMHNTLFFDKIGHI